MSIVAELPEQGALSEFVAGFHGDCGEDAELMALHALRGTPLTEQSLREIVTRHQQHGWADASGAEPLAAIARDLDLLGVRYTLYPYCEPWPEAEWHPLLLAHAGRQPIILQVANAQALPGDERGVSYHFICVEGVDLAGYATGDGDNAAARTGMMVTYDIGQLAAARPCGMIVCARTVLQESRPAAATESPMDSHAVASHPATAPETHPASALDGPPLDGPPLDLAGLGAGVRGWLAAHAPPPMWRVLLAEEPDSAGGVGSTITVLGDERGDQVIYWDGPRGQFSTVWGGHAALHLLARARTAEARLADTKAQLAAAQAQTNDLARQIATAAAHTTTMAPTAPKVVPDGASEVGSSEVG